MGVLGLKTLLYFAQQHGDNARLLLAHMDGAAGDLSCAYPLAIAGINVAADLLQLLEGACCC